ncbi:MAG: Hsp70 family protein, partial [Pseudomonadota bacterium]
AEHGDKVEGEVKSEIEAAMADLKTAAEGEDVEDIKAKTQALTEAAMKLGEAIYKAQMAEGEAAAEAAPEGEAPEDAKSDDDVVDADFTEVDENDRKAG